MYQYVSDTYLCSLMILWVPSPQLNRYLIKVGQCHELL